MAPEEPVEEAEAMVPQAEYNNLSQKYDQLNTEYGVLQTQRGDHLLVVIMKLRLGLNNRDIAYRFKISERTISNILRSWLPVMANLLKSSY